MSCTVDSRTGSGDLVPLLKRRGVDVEIGRLEYGDVSIIGNGPEGCPVAIGVEVKQISDVLKCITDGRFAGHQLPGLIQTYQFRYLLIEGRYRPDVHSGILQWMTHKGLWANAAIGNRAFMYKELDHWLMTMEMRGGMRIVRAYDRHEAVCWLADLYHWWCSKEFEEHKSHLSLNESGAIDQNVLVRPSLVRRMAKELPGVGLDRSAAVAKEFHTPLDMILADESEWRDIEGIGKVTARKIMEALGHK